VKTLGKTTIKVTCLDQRLVISSGPVIASGGLNENKIVFDFCPLWREFVKTAVFYRNEDQVYYAVLESDDTCLIPWEVTSSEGDMYFGVFGVKEGITRTSETLRYKITAGAITEDIKPSDPTPEIYEQILATYEQILATCQGTIETVNHHALNKENPHGVTAKQIGAADVDHGHGRISKDGRIGDEANLPLFTGLDGEVITVDVPTARSLLGIPDDEDVEIEVDNEVTADGTKPVSGAAVAAYALPKSAIVTTTTDPGDGVATEYPDGTVILVYE
jgi:hypothetical protein